MLFIAEKPSVGRAIAEQLGIIHKSDGYIDCKGNHTVTWCFGHLFELAEPDIYLGSVPAEDGKRLWRWEDLPIIPQKWIIQPKKDCKKQIKVIADLLKKNSCVVNAGDPDREGQLLIDELLEYQKYSGTVKRYWCNAVDPVSIQRALSSLKSNTEYSGMKESAQARGRADWLVGMNMSRAYTLAAHKLITIGRVQSPTLKLVVDRDREIQRFRPIPYYVIKAVFEVPNGKFTAEMINDETVDGLDSEGRLIKTDAVKKILTELNNQQNAEIIDYSNEKKEERPPLGLSLSDVQSKASATWGYAADEVLALCQSLYEKKLTTYPRTDCNYLPVSQYDDAKAVLSAVKNTTPELADFISKADLTVKTKIWNDAKTTAHHAIIPTMSAGASDSLSEKEKNIYTLVAKYYIAQFYPNYQYNHTVIKVKFESLPYTFKATGRVDLQPGWREILKSTSKDKEQDQLPQLPVTAIGEQARKSQAGYIQKTTTPPAKFTEGSLIKAMENIYKYIDDPEMKKLLKDGDGIGTSATRAGIIKELKNRKFLETSGKFIVSTEQGRSIVDQIPTQFKSPAMTALFERVLSQIENQTAKADDFLNLEIQEITKEINKVRNSKIKIDGIKSNVSQIYKCMTCGGGLIRRNGKFGYFWSCENYPKCKTSYNDNNGKPIYKKS